MRKLLFAAFAVLFFSAGALAQVFTALPQWTASTRFGDTPGTVGFNITSNAAEFLDNNATWHSIARTDGPSFTGTLSAAAIAATSLTSGSAVVTTTIRQTTAYSAAGTALPTCNAGAQGTTAWVTDATAPTYLAVYTSGGAVVAPVFCDGTNWITP